MLQVANGDVRANAAALLMDAFPLLCTEDGLEEVDAFTQQQFDQIEVEIVFSICLLFFVMG